MIVTAVLSIVLLSVGLAVALERAGRRDGTGSASQAMPVLGGQAPVVHAWSRFHFRAYPMLLVFIAFEMEMVFMYPWAVVFVDIGVKAMAEMAMFLTILALGVLYAWREGVFRWQ
ncbi:MAG: NADH-quinone oxidoreductase subunit A [Burkholderiaceae bacterium]